MPARQKLKLTGFAVSLGLMLVVGATWLLIRHVAALWDEGPALERGYVLVVAAICLVAGAWNGYRANHASALQLVRFRQRWRKGRWREDLGFAVAMALFGTMLGVFCAIPKWLPRAAENAGEITLVYIAVSATAFFVGGFALPFAPIRRSTRR